MEVVKIKKICLKIQYATLSGQTNLKGFCSSMPSQDVTRLRFLQLARKSAWKAWLNFDCITEIFIKLESALTKADVKDAMPMLERFVVLMYDRTSNCLDVNSCQRDLFVKKGHAMESLPPTFKALLQHTYRAAYQAGYVWRQSLVHQQQLPSPENWGWKRVGETYAPHWSDFAEAAVAVRTDCMWMHSRKRLQREMQMY